MPPALFPRSIQIARLLKGLKRIGWSSTVITTDLGDLAPEDVIDPALAGAYASSYTLSPVSLSRVDRHDGPILERWRQRLNGERALSDEQLWVKRAAAAAVRAARTTRARAMVTFAQPWRDHLAGLACRKQTGLPWLAHFSDPWVDSVYESDLPAARKARERQLEAQVIEQADAVVFTNAYAADLVMAKYPAAWRKKVDTVPHTMDEDLIPDVDRLGERPAARSPRPLRIAHVGNLFAGRRTAQTLFDVLAAMNARQPLAGRLEVVFVGEGSGLYEAREKVFLLSLESIVTFRPRVAHLESLAAMRESDALLLIDAPADTNVFLPSKVVDYLMAARPILALTPGTGPTADLMRQAGYPVIAPADTAAIGAAIDRLLREHERGPLAAPAAAADVTAGYRLDRTAAAFAAILDRVARVRS